VPAAFVAVPEAAVHEYHGAIFRQHEIRTSRQRTGVEPVAQSGSMKEAPETQLWRSVSLAYPRHHPRACCGVDDVRHCGSTGCPAFKNAGYC
jgi:hypothetical protein